MNITKVLMVCLHASKHWHKGQLQDFFLIIRHQNRSKTVRDKFKSSHTHSHWRPHFLPGHPPPAPPPPPPPPKEHHQLFKKINVQLTLKLKTSRKTAVSSVDRILPASTFTLTPRLRSKTTTHTHSPVSVCMRCSITAVSTSSSDIAGTSACLHSTHTHTRPRGCKQMHLLRNTGGSSVSRTVTCLPHILICPVNPLYDTSPPMYSSKSSYLMSSTPDAGLVYPSALCLFHIYKFYPPKYPWSLFALLKRTNASVS